MTRWPASWAGVSLTGLRQRGRLRGAGQPGPAEDHRSGPHSARAPAPIPTAPRLVIVESGLLMGRVLSCSGSIVTQLTDLRYLCNSVTSWAHS